MSEDRRRPGQYASHRDRSLRPWIVGAVYPYSEPLRRALDAAGLGRLGLRRADQLHRLPVTERSTLGDGRRFVLCPTRERLRSLAPPAVKGRLLLADVLGRTAEFTREHVDRPFKPLVWVAVPTDAGPLLIGAAAPDLDRLAALGRRGLAISGVRPDDRVLRTAPGGAGVGVVQLGLGCRDAGIASLQVDPDADPQAVDRSEPTVVAGTVDDLDRLVGAGLPPSVRLLVVHATPTLDADAVDALGIRAGLPTSVWWAPAGTRAAWVSCPGGHGFHTWPTHEYLEVLDDADRPAVTGRLVWSPVGWHGSVWLRVALGPTVAVEREVCPTCRRTTPRVRPVPVPPGYVSVLDGLEGVRDWVAVRRRSGVTQVLVLPTSREQGSRVRADVRDRAGLDAVLVGPRRFAAVRELAGGARTVDEDLVSSLMRRAGAR